MEQRITDSEAAMSSAVAAAIADEIMSAVQARGRALVGFSGGSTPAAMLSELAAADLPWEQVVVFQVDERVAPEGDPDRNAQLLCGNLLDHVAATAYLMPVTREPLEGAAADYAALLADTCGGVLDVVHLGLGADGHTASLVPGDPVLEVTDTDVAVTGRYQGRRRMTLTYPAINRARRIVWEIAGADKAEAVRSMVDGGDVPGAGIVTGPALLITDAAAGALLSQAR